DLHAEIVASPSQEALGRLSRIDPETLVIGLSAGRPHPLISRTMKLARHRKAPTLAITDATLSEVARMARIRLYYSSNTPAFVRSHTALLSLIEAMAFACGEPVRLDELELKIAATAPVGSFLAVEARLDHREGQELRATARGKANADYVCSASGSFTAWLST